MTIKNSIFSIILLLSAFFIIYNISFSEESVINSARLTIFSLFIVVIFFIKKKPILDLKTLIIFIPVPYVLLQYLFVGDTHQISRFIHLFLYAFIGAALLSTIINSLKNALIIIFAATVIQSLIIILSFMNINIRELLGQTIVISGNFTYENIYRGIGFTSTSGAALSVIQSMGVLTGYLLLTQINQLSPYTKKIIFTLILLIFISTIFTGRTGMIMSVVFTFLFLTKINKKEFSWLVVIMIAFSFFLKKMFEENISDNFSLDYFYQWAFGAFSEGDNTISILLEMPIPKLSIEAFFGTGLSSIINGSNASGHDSGIIQTYYSIGLIMSIVFFSSYLYLLNRAFSWIDKKTAFFLTIIFFLIELKEPFVFKYSHLFIILLFYYSSLKEKRNA